MPIGTVLERNAIIKCIEVLLKKYNAESAVLFGSYARGEAGPDSDIDVVIFGGPNFKPSDIFALAEELRELTNRDADVFEIRELNEGTDFYDAIMREGLKIA